MTSLGRWIGIVSLLLCTSVWAEEDWLLTEEKHFADTLFSGISLLETNSPLWPNFSPSNAPLILSFDNGHWFGVGIQEAFAPKESFEGTQSGLTIHYATTPLSGEHLSNQGSHIINVDSVTIPVLHIRDDDFQTRNRLSALIQLIKDRFVYFSHTEDVALKSSYLALESDSLDPFSRRLMRPKRIAMLKLAREQLIDYVHSGDPNHLVNYLSLHREIDYLLSDEERVRWRIAAIEGVGAFIGSKIAERFFPQVMLREQINALLAPYNPEENLVKWLNYDREIGVAAALAYALERFDVEQWQTQFSTLSLEDILFGVIDVSLEEQQSRVKAMLESNYYALLLAQAEDAIEAYEDHTLSLQIALEKAQGVQLLLLGNFMAFGEDRGQLPIEDGQLATIDFQGMLLMPNKAAKLTLDNQSFIQLKPGELSIAMASDYLDVTVNAQPSMRMSKTAKWARPFDTLTWSNDKISAEIETKGYLIADDGKLTIQIY